MKTITTRTQKNRRFSRQMTIQIVAVAVVAVVGVAFIWRFVYRLMCVAMPLGTKIETISNETGHMNMPTCMYIRIHEVG